MITKDVRNWLRGEGEQFLRDIGIKNGKIVLDFGCGEGHYTIPAAKVVGEKGKVYAVDKNKTSLKYLMEMAASEGIKNIIPMKTSEELRIELEDESIDVILLYDVLHSHYFVQGERRRILKEVYRIAKTDALISIFPKHMVLEEIKKEVENTGFYLEREIFKRLVHNDYFDRDYVLNFRKNDYKEDC